MARAAGKWARVGLSWGLVALLVGVGDEVEAGQGVIVIEAMKMENELKASRPGVVREIRAESGQAVEGGAKLVLIAAPEVEE